MSVTPRNAVDELVFALDLVANAIADTRSEQQNVAEQLHVRSLAGLMRQEYCTLCFDPTIGGNSTCDACLTEIAQEDAL